MRVKPTHVASAARSAANGSAFCDEREHDAEPLKGTIGERAKTGTTTRIDQASQAMIRAVMERGSDCALASDYRMN